MVLALNIAFFVLPCLQATTPPLTKTGGPTQAGQTTSLELPSGRHVRTFDIGRLTRAFQWDQPPAMGSILGEVLSGYQRFPVPANGDAPEDLVEGRLLHFRGDVEGGPISSDLLVDRLRTLVAPNTWERDGVAIAVHGNQLQITHDKAILAQCGEFLERLERAIAPRYRVEALLFDSSLRENQAVPGLVRLTAKQAGTLRRTILGTQGESFEFGSAELRPGDMVRFGRRHTKRAATEIAAEVSENASIYATTRSKLELGASLTLLAHLQPDGTSLALFGLLTDRPPFEPAKPEKIVAGHSLTFTPTACVNRQAAFSTAIHATDAVLFTPGGNSKLGALVFVKRLSPNPAADHGAVAVPFRLLATRVFDIRLDDEDPRRLSATRLDTDDVLEQVAQATGRDTLSMESETLFFSGDRATESSVRAVLGYLGQSKRRTFALELRVEARQQAPESAWKSVGSPLVTACIGGQLTFLIDGEEYAFIGGYDAQIAKDKSIGNPKVEGCFAGTAIAALITPSGEGCRVRLDLLQRSIAGFERHAPTSDQVGPTWQPRESSVRYRRELYMLPGKPYLLGSAAMTTLHGQPVNTRLKLTLREIRAR